MEMPTLASYAKYSKPDGYCPMLHAFAITDWVSSKSDLGQISTNAQASNLTDNAYSTFHHLLCSFVVAQMIVSGSEITNFGCVSSMRRWDSLVALLNRGFRAVVLALIEASVR